MESMLLFKFSNKSSTHKVKYEIYVGTQIVINVSNFITDTGNKSRASEK